MAVVDILQEKIAQLEGTIEASGAGMPADQLAIAIDSLITLKEQLKQLEGNAGRPADENGGTAV